MGVPHRLSQDDYYDDYWFLPGKGRTRARIWLLEAVRTYALTLWSQSLTLSRSVCPGKEFSENHV